MLDSENVGTKNEKARSAFALLAETSAAERNPAALVEYDAPLGEEHSETQQAADQER
jgi:hypothetical protein